MMIQLFAYYNLFSDIFRVITDPSLVANILREDWFHEISLLSPLADVPSSTLSLGSSLNASNIKEGTSIFVYIIIILSTVCLQI